MSDFSLLIILTSILGSAVPTVAAVMAYFEVRRVKIQGDVIHAAVNSNLTAVKADLVEAKIVITRLQELIINQQTTINERRPGEKL